MQTRLINILEKELLKESPVKSSAPKPKFRPSQLGSPCLRKIYYSYLNVPEDFPASLQLKKYAELGSRVGDMLSDLFRTSGILVDYKDLNGNFKEDFYNPGKIDYEFPVKDEELNVSAKIDGVLIIDGKLWLGEWKTATVNSFSRLSAPKSSHLVQGTTYVFAFENALKEGKYSHIKELNGFTEVTGIIFLYANKDDLSLKEFSYTKDQCKQVFTETIGKIVSVKSHVENDSLPSKTPDWCNSCSWRKKCLLDFKAKV